MPNESGQSTRNTGKKILYIEDQWALSRVMYNKLVREGLRVVLAGDGDEGLRKLKTEKPDLILLDLILPIKNGLEFLAEAKKKKLIRKEVPVLIFSELGQDTDIAKCKQLGATEYIIKSDISIIDVVKKIKKYLE